MVEEKYINPFTYFGFKKLFGEEISKNSLIDFLNQLLSSKNKITELKFKQTDNLASIFPIQDQDKKSDLDYKLTVVYGLGILDFIFNEDEENKDKYIHYV
jgi:hypothetical protein